MKALVMTKLLHARALGDGEGGAIQLETQEGALELRFTFEAAERLIAELQTAQARIQRQRARSGEAPLAERQKAVERWETGVDPVNQVAVLRAHFEDHSTQETRIARSDIGGIAEFLAQALKRLEPGTDMRQ